MKPVSNIFLSVLLLALCGLCGWQWNRESQLRAITTSQQNDIASLHAAKDELESRVKAADGEVLRITASLAELRANSVSKDVHEEALQAIMQIKEVVEKQNAAITQQNAAITQQNELITKQNTAITQANDTIKKLTSERDDLARKLNDVTARYNKLANPDGEAPKPKSAASQ